MQHARVTLPIYNLAYGGGSALALERGLTAISGVARVSVNPLTEMAYVIYDPALATVEQLTRLVDGMGYGPPHDHGRGQDRAANIISAQLRSEVINQEQITPAPGISVFFRSPTGLVLLALLAIAGLYLAIEESALVYRLLPYALILLCPLLHLFMHRGHGAPEQHKAIDQAQRREGVEQ